jgi:hypothetical protein
VNRTMIETSLTTHRLRRVGRIARHRLRIEEGQLANGVHTDGRLTVTISGLGSPSAGAPDTFEWQADRPIALVIVRSGIDGEDVAFAVGPMRSGRGAGASIGDGTGIRYIAFCYDAEPDTAPALVPYRSSAPAAAARPAQPVMRANHTVSAAASGTHARRSILGQMLRTGSAAA